eukprot:s1179_g6.t1
MDPESQTLDSDDDNAVIPERKKGLAVITHGVLVNEYPLGVSMAKPVETFQDSQCPPDEVQDSQCPPDEVQDSQCPPDEEVKGDYQENNIDSQETAPIGSPWEDKNVKYPKFKPSFLESAASKAEKNVTPPQVENDCQGPPGHHCPKTLEALLVTPPHKIRRKGGTFFSSSGSAAESDSAAGSQIASKAVIELDGGELEIDEGGEGDSDAVPEKEDDEAGEGDAGEGDAGEGDAGEGDTEEAGEGDAEKEDDGAGEGDEQPTSSGCDKKDYAERQRLLQDPRFKKGTKIKDLSPQSQVTLREVRRLRSIENSNNWHRTFQSKGVKKTESESAPGEVPPPRDRQPARRGNGGDQPAEPNIPPDEKPKNLKDAQFLKEYFAEHKGDDMTTQQKMKAANAAWMVSEVRSRVLASRGGVASI